jgi:hypothetical protein
MIELPKKSENANDVVGTFLKLHSAATKQIAEHKVETGCAICSVYEALAKRGWLKNKSETDYKNHLLARHGLEA